MAYVVILRRETIRDKNKENSVPPVKKAVDQDVLVATSEYPYAKWKFEKFNPVQSRMMDFYDKETSGLIAASTSAGKTVVAEMFMADEIRRRGGKAMFLAPLRALAREKVDEWTDKNYHFADLNVSICTGDYRLTKERTKELAEADLIIMTSEMLNHRSRNFKAEQNNWLKSVGTLVIDESHLLTVAGRGDHLEVGLMKFTQINPTARLVLLSATMPNVEEIADWVSYSLTKRDTFMLRSKYRPVPLTIHYEAYSDNMKRYDLVEEEKINKAMDIVEWYPDDKFLIFAHTKRTGEMMKQALKTAGIECQFHNADLQSDERIKVESRFRNDPKLRVIVATSTLAWGCYAKGTTVLMENGLKKIEDVKVGDFVLAYDFKDKMVPKIVEKVGKIKPNKCLQFILETGENVVVSEDHKFYGVYDDKKLDFYEADKFKVGDSLTTYSKDFRFSSITEIKEVPNCEMYDLQVSELHNYVGGGVLSHNCNLPARRVIILGVHRGLGEVESHDIIQMIGRSGRLGIDPMGDAYILVPESRKDEFRRKFSNPNRIESQLLEKVGDHHKVLAFHLASEIHHGDIQTTDDVHQWYQRSLAHFQNKSLHDIVVDKTLELLKKCGAIGEENGILIAKPIGKVASMFYFSPFDASDLYFNFKNLFDQNKEDDDYSVSMALANIDSQRMNIVSKAEKEEISAYANKVRAASVGKFYTDAALKAGYCYFNLLNGVNSQVLSAVQRGLQFDFNRLSQILQALDSMGGNWEAGKYFKTLEGRIVNGVPAHLVNLCQLPNIGKVRASKLYSAGYKTAESIADMNFEQFKKLTNLKEDAAKEIIDHAKNLAMFS
jgi:replicative superfamily II helicase